MQHPDEGTIHAWIDGALDVESARELETHVATCEECARVVAEARGLVAASSRILTALDNVPGDVIPVQSTTAKKPQRAMRPWATPFWMRTAAAVLVVAATSALVFTAKLNNVERKRADIAMSAESDLAQVRPQAEAPVVAPAPVSRDAAANASVGSAAGREGDAQPLSARTEAPPASRQTAGFSTPTVATTAVAKEKTPKDVAASESRVAENVNQMEAKKAATADRMDVAIAPAVPKSDSSTLVGSVSGILAGVKPPSAVGKTSINRDMGTTRSSVPSAAPAIAQRGAAASASGAAEMPSQQSYLDWRPRAAIGCYALTLSPWSGATVPFGAPPAQIELDSLTSVQESIRGLGLVHPAPGAASNGAPLAYWRVVRDSVVITWRDNARGVALTLPVDGEVVQGKARTFATTSRDGAEQTARVEARRISCRR